MKRCEKIDRYLNKALSDAEESAFSEHLVSCDECRTKTASWNEFEVRLKKWADYQPASEVSVIDVFSLMRAAASISNRTQNQSRWKAVAISAAAVLSTTAIAIFILSYTSPSKIQNDEIVNVRVFDSMGIETIHKLKTGSELEAPSNKHMVASIQDDTIGLVSKAKLRILRAEKNRTLLRLESGKVSCKVAKRHEKGEFVVEAGQLSVKVMGTKFTVFLTPLGTTEVTVEEGLVQVTDQTGKVLMLKAGEKTASTQKGTIEKSFIADKNELLLTSRLLDPKAELEESVIFAEKTHKKLSILDEPTSLPKEIRAEINLENEDKTETEQETETKPIAKLETPPIKKWEKMVIDGKVNEAVSSMRRYLNSTPDDTSVLALLADSERKRGNYSVSVKYYETVIAKGSPTQKARATYMLASVLQSHLGKYEQALKLFLEYTKSPYAVSELLKIGEINIVQSLVELRRCKEATDAAEKIKAKGGSFAISKIDRMIESCN